MATFQITCSGPGPHVPADGVLGTSDRPQTADVRCAATACVKPVDITVQNQQALQAKAQAALSANATYLAIASPTNAQVSAQVQTLTKECNAIIRLLIGALDSTSGT